MIIFADIFVKHFDKIFQVYKETNFYNNNNNSWMNK